MNGIVACRFLELLVLLLVHKVFWRLPQKEIFVVILEFRQTEVAVLMVKETIVDSLM